MKRLFVAIGASLALGSFAYTPSAKADPCSALLCMAGEPNAGPGCAGYVSEFFAIQIWGISGFKPAATARARQGFLNSCPGSESNQAVIERIIATYGTLIAAP